VRAALLLLLLATGLAHAAPEVMVKGRTRIAIDSVRRTGEGVRVTGKLVEASTGAGIEGGDVTLRILGQVLTVTTEAAGRFEAEFQLGEGVYEVEAHFEGDPSLDSSEMSGYRFDVGKESLELSVRTPLEVDVSAGAAVGGMEVIVDARTDSGGVRVPVRLELGDASARQLVDVGKVETTFDGQGRTTIAVTELGEPGDKRLRARFVGDDAFNPAESETTFRVSTSTRIADLAAPSSPVKHEAKLAFRGRLLDGRGLPVARGAMALVSAGRRVADALTEEDGTFTLRVKAAELGPGAVTLTVEHISAVSWRKGSRSVPTTLTILEPQPVPVAYTISAFALAFAALVGFVLARTRPWRPLLLGWRRRRRRPELGQAAEAGGRVADAPPASGLVLAKPGIISTLRRPADHGFSGRVRDVVRGVPVAGAQVVIWLHSSDAAVLVSDEAGRFEVEPLPAGTWRVEVACFGFVTERFEVSIPHRGELRGVRVDLVPVRERVFHIYRDVALGLLPQPALWGVWTPREIFDHVRSRRPAGALGALTDFVEETYFSPRVPDESILPDASARARAAMVER
jgi:hypothetical protein